MPIFTWQLQFAVRLTLIWVIKINKMKAIQYTGYGDTQVIKLNQVEKPAPKDDEILIRITATTVNPMEMKIRNGYLILLL